MKLGITKLNRPWNDVSSEFDFLVECCMRKSKTADISHSKQLENCCLCVRHLRSVSQPREPFFSGNLKNLYGDCYA